MSYNLKKAKEKDDKSVRVGAGVVIVKDNCILLGKRKGGVGDGEYGLPGGSLELGESLEECAIREVKEETNLILNSVKKICTETDNKNYLYVYYVSYIDDDSELENLEPDKSENWKWYSVDDLPNPLFGEIDEVIKGI
jgi:8-oxo-dGTP diphosphatase